MKRRLVLLILSVFALIISWGSLVTIHATTPHRCSKYVDRHGDAITHECHHDGRGDGKGQHQETRADNSPIFPPWPFPDGGNTGCVCPLDSWNCFTGSLSGKVLTKRSASSILQHGLFYRGK